MCWRRTEWRVKRRMSGWRAWYKVSGPRQGDNSALWHSSSYDSHDSFREAHRHQIGTRISLKLDLRTCRLLRREGMLHIPLISLIFLTLPDRLFAILRSVACFGKFLSTFHLKPA